VRSKLQVLRGSDNLGCEAAGYVVGNGAVVHYVVCAVAAGRVVVVVCAVHGKLVEVHTEAVALGVAVCEESCLEDCEVCLS